MTASPVPTDLDVYDIAFLAGGPARVVDTALVRLVESGRVRVHAPGELAVAEPSRRHPVEAAVLDAVGTRGHRSVETIRWRLDGDQRLLDVGRRLCAAGLLRRGSSPRWLHQGGEVTRRTRAGSRALRRITEAPPALGAADDGSSALLVALGGRQAMPDPGLRSAIFERPAAPHLRPEERIRRRLDIERARAERAAYDPRASWSYGPGGAGDGGGGFDGGGGG